MFVRVLSSGVCVFVCAGGLRKEHGHVTAPPPVLHTLSATRPNRIYLTRQVRVAAAPGYLRNGPPPQMLFPLLRFSEERPLATEIFMYNA